MSQPSRKEIENRAYELWKKSGRPEGREEERNEAKSSPFDWAKIMSYNDDANWNLASLDPATPMPLDVLALQYLYGQNQTLAIPFTHFCW